jgi:chromosome segregation ATPase
MIEQKATYTLAEYEKLQYQYDQLNEKYAQAQEQIGELVIERNGLKYLIADAKARFDEVASDCGKMLDQIKSHQQHI